VVAFDGWRRSEASLRVKQHGSRSSRLWLKAGDKQEDGCAPSTRTLLAKRIIETAQKGERNANRLVEDGLTYLSELK
jgi:hypothetical protein